MLSFHGNQAAGYSVHEGWQAGLRYYPFVGNLYPPGHGQDGWRFSPSSGFAGVTVERMRQIVRFVDGLPRKEEKGC